MTRLDVEVVDIRKVTGDGSLRAFADVRFCNLVIKGFSVVNGKNGVFVSMPRKANKEGRWFDILMPMDDGLKREIEDKVLEAYGREVDGVPA